jgi:hypothetical protein
MGTRKSNKTWESEFYRRRWIFMLIVFSDLYAGILAILAIFSGINFIALLTENPQMQRWVPEFFANRDMNFSLAAFLVCISFGGILSVTVCDLWKSEIKDK